jgi:hypothetical protein
VLPGSVQLWEGLYVKRQNIHLSRTHVPGQGHPVGKRLGSYEHEKPISPPYKITHDTAINYSTAGWGHAVEALMHTAQNDVEEEHLPEVKRIFHPK